MRARLRLLSDSAVAAWNWLRMPGRSYRGPLPPTDQALAELAAEIRRHVICLAEEIGERNLLYRPASLRRAAEYIEAQFAATGLAVRRQQYDIDGAVCNNIEVEIAGRGAPTEIVLFGAHYDTVCGSPGANDNGSGVAAVLALAPCIAAYVPERTVRFVAFVNEEKPFGQTQRMGSWVYARRCRERGEQVTAMLSLETIGYYRDLPATQTYPSPIGRLYPSTGNFVAFIGNTRYGKLVRQVVGAFRRSEPFPSEAGAVPTTISDISRSDHWSFWQHGYPALMVTDTANFRYPHYHTPEDTVDKLDFDRTARVVRGLKGVLDELAYVER